MNAPEQETRDGPTAERSLSPDARIVVWAGAALALLVLVAVAFTFVPRPQFDPATPEGVVQRYLQAVVEGRRTEARSYLSDRLQRECEPGFPRYTSRDAYRIELMESVVDGSTAEVHVMVAEQDGGLFDYYYEFSVSYSLVSTGGGWRITDQEWPWYGCSEPMLDREEGF